MTRAPAPRRAEVTSSLVERTLAAPGQSLETNTRVAMERRFNHDFSRVRVHADPSAARSARAVNALAYTVGEHVAFAEGQYAAQTEAGRWLLAHELAHVVQQERAPAPILRRRCGPELGEPSPDCTPSDLGVVGWQFLFKVNCDELLPGEEANLAKLKSGKRLNLHGFASLEGPPAFNLALSCHRANRIAALIGEKRPDCTVGERFKHRASPVSAPGVPPDVNRPGFWRAVIVQETEPAAEPKPTPCAGVPAATPATCKGRHDAYAAARKCFPLDSWLICVDRASADVCRAIEAFSFSSSEGRDLEKCVTVTPGGDAAMTRAKAAWLDRTNACIWGHWRAALEPLHQPALPIPAGLTPEWTAAVQTCRADGVGNSTCCEAQVVAEQTAIDHCGPYDSSLFGTQPTDVPYSQLCSDVVKLATPGLPFAGDFGDVEDRIAYGQLRCCLF